MCMSSRRQVEPSKYWWVDVDANTQCSILYLSIPWASSRRFAFVSSWSRSTEGSIGKNGGSLPSGSRSSQSRNERAGEQSRKRKARESRMSSRRKELIRPLAWQEIVELRCRAAEEMLESRHFSPQPSSEHNYRRSRIGFKKLAQDLRHWRRDHIINTNEDSQQKREGGSLENLNNQCVLVFAAKIGICLDKRDPQLRQRVVER